MPPTTNNAYATVHGRRVLSSAGRAYKLDVGLSLVRQKAKPIRGKPRLRVTVVLHHHRLRYGYDVLNFEKLLTDGMVEAGLFADDKQIDDHRYIRGDARPPRGCAEVMIEEIVPVAQR